jgi:deoxyribonuclease V
MVNIEHLKEEQRKLSRNIILQDRFKKIEKIAGIDQTYDKNNVISCIVICNAKSMEVIEKQTATVPAPIVYKPGLLAYREMPAMIEAFSKVTNTPDVIIVDGHGISHPRRCGLASHFGLIISRPTIGIAQSLVTGKVEQGKIFDERDMIGFELKTKEHAKPIYVSPGHMITPGTALHIAKDSIRHPHKLPEPLHLAHKAARKELKKLMETA